MSLQAQVTKTVIGICSLVALAACKTTEAADSGIKEATSESRTIEFDEPADVQSLSSLLLAAGIQYTTNGGIPGAASGPNTVLNAVEVRCHSDLSSDSVSCEMANYVGGPRGYLTGNKAVAFTSLLSSKGLRFASLAPQGVISDSRHLAVAWLVCQKNTLTHACIMTVNAPYYAY